MNAHRVIHFIQTSLYNGKESTSAGYYVFSRKELAEGARLSVATFDKCKDDVIEYFSSHCDFKTWAKYDEYAGEILYIDVSYEKGKLKFKRNPLTLQPHLSHLWALPPVRKTYTSDAFDNKHRRRTRSYRCEYDAIPWDWDADLWEQLVKEGKTERINEIINNPPKDSVLLQQANSALCIGIVVLFLEGYNIAEQHTVSSALYSAVEAMYPELCEFLLAHGADPNEIIMNGYSSMTAIAGMHKKGPEWEKVVKLLIDAGGNLTNGNFNTCSFAGEIFEKGSDDVCRDYIDALHKQGLLNFVSITQQTPMSVLKIYKGFDNELVRYMEALLQE